MFEGINQSVLAGPFKAYRTDAEGNVTWTDTRWSLLIDPVLVEELRQGAIEEGYEVEFNACLHEPTPAQIAEFHLPVWGGNDPAAAYLRLPADMTRQKLKRVLRRLLSE